MAGHQILNNLMVQNGPVTTFPAAGRWRRADRRQPELLIRKGGEIHTNPLAACAPSGRSAAGSFGSERPMRSTKDKYEHKLVIDASAPPGAKYSRAARARRCSAPAPMWHLSTPLAASC